MGKYGKEKKYSVWGKLNGTGEIKYEKRSKEEGNRTGTVRKP